MRMALALVTRRQLQPRVQFTVGRATLRFYHGDCLSVLPELEAQTVGIVVTSPPYNLGIKYRSYKDDMPRREYLNWTDRWIRAVSRVLAPQGSLFLNVGAKPTDPWIPLEVAQVARRRLKLQNTIHWVKSIAIDREAAGGKRLSEDVAVGHYKPINSERFVNDCHEYIFHFSPGGQEPAGPAGRRRAVPGRVEHQAMGATPAADSGAVATRGSSRTKRFRAATATGRIPHHSRRKSRNNAFACTASTARAW